MKHRGFEILSFEPRPGFGIYKDGRHIDSGESIAACIVTIDEQLGIIERTVNQAVAAAKPISNMFDKMSKASLPKPTAEIIQLFPGKAK